MAAELLGLSEKTVRAWAAEGLLLAAASDSLRLLLDVERVHVVRQLLADLRAAGSTTSLIDGVYRRLTDLTWLDREDLVESLAQMRRGEGVVLVTGDGV